MNNNELNLCTCGGNASVHELDVDTFDPEYNTVVYWVECDVCGEKTRPFIEIEQAKCSWNNVEYVPEEIVYECFRPNLFNDKYFPPSSSPFVSLLESLASKKNT